VLLAGDLDLIEKGELGTPNKDIAEIERMIPSFFQHPDAHYLQGHPLLPRDWKQ
jgi:hypothetical protein